MSEPKHSPPPWKVLPYVDAIDVADADGKLVAHLADRDIASIGMPPDNARLIAASPRLLAALDTLVRLLNGPADFTTQQIDAAIRAGIEALQEAGVYE